MLPALLSLGCSSGEPVTFSLTAPQVPFLSGGEVTVAIYDAEQLARRERGADCMVSWDGEQERTRCPDGRTPEPVEPEVFTFPQSALAAPLQITSATVTTGERYEINIGGTAADGCNSSGGSASGAARAVAIDLLITEVFTTEMACID